MKRRHTPLGYVVYQGPSLLAPEVDIVCIVNCLAGSTNEKTGRMAQSWILREDIAPNVAIKQKKDQPICGSCPYGGGQGCYVSMKPVTSIYRAFQAGRYVRAPLPEVVETLKYALQRRRITGFRAGAYGDPAAVPTDIWSTLMGAVREAGGRTTGYTHQWNARYAHEGRTADPELRHWVMASAHGSADQAKAEAEGWRAFVSVQDSKSLRELRHAAVCPASEDAGYLRTCDTCGACNGRKDDSDRRVSISITVHGTDVVKNKAAKATQEVGVKHV